MPGLRAGSFRNAVRRLAPTPDNYRQLYEEIGGAPAMAVLNTFVCVVTNVVW